MDQSSRCFSHFCKVVGRGGGGGGSRGWQTGPYITDHQMSSGTGATGKRVWEAIEQGTEN